MTDDQHLSEIQLGCLTANTLYTMLLLHGCDSKNIAAGVTYEAIKLLIKDRGINEAENLLDDLRDYLRQLQDSAFL
ncbi:MAG: hypothetical protein AB2794_11600 [Candidatus Thiodiazotropha endolucinida]